MVKYSIMAFQKPVRWFSRSEKQANNRYEEVRQGKIETGKIAQGPDKLPVDEDEGSHPQGWANRTESR
jgi:hypothetical protein